MLNQLNSMAIYKPDINIHYIEVQTYMAIFIYTKHSEKINEKSILYIKLE